MLLVSSGAQAVASLRIDGFAVTVVLLMLAIGVVGGLSAWLFLRYKPRQAVAALYALDALATTAAQEETDAVADWADILGRCVDRGKNARTYSSLAIARDNRLRSRPEDDRVTACWRIDFVQPDRYHVSQAMRDSELGWLYDEWISIDDDHYRNSGLWFRTPERHDEFHHGLSLRGVLGALEQLRSVEPTGRAVYRYRKERYLVGDYGNPPPLGLFDRSALPGTIDRTFRVWINLRTGFVAKSQLEIRGTAEDGAVVDVSVDHMFGCYNERVTVRAPKWVNAIPTDGGKFTIVDVRIPDVRHYGGHAALAPRFTPASDTRAAVFRSRVDT